MATTIDAVIPLVAGKRVPIKNHKSNGAANIL